MRKLFLELHAMPHRIIKKSLALHKKHRGKTEICIKMPMKTRKHLSLIYTPGVGGVSQEIARDKSLTHTYTSKGNTIAIISDGSAVLGFGNIGPEAAIPVMEGKSVLFKKFANIDAFPIVLGTQDADEIIRIVKGISPTFSAINLEDISAPRCFEIEERLINELDIPVMHDDQHGTAIIVLAALINALKVVKKKKESVRVVINGAGAAGIAVTKILSLYGFSSIALVDSRGVISRARNDLNQSKKDILPLVKPEGVTLQDAIKGADVFIGVSAPNIVTKEMVRSMNKDAIVFAMANPVPEIMPQDAKEAGARVVASGRSDFPNQINNALVFPGVFRGLLDYRIKKLTPEMKIRAAKAIASLIKKPTAGKIIPDIFDKRIVPAIRNAMKK